MHDFVQNRAVRAGRLGASGSQNSLVVNVVMSTAGVVQTIGMDTSADVCNPYQQTSVKR